MPRTLFMITCARPGCPRQRETHRPQQRFCSRKCAAQVAPWRAECGRRGGALSAERRRLRALHEVQRLWPGMSHEAAVAVRAAMARSYQAGWRARRRADQEQPVQERFA